MPVIPAIALAEMVVWAGPPTKRIIPLFRILFTVTVNAGTLTDARVTPDIVAG